jgi:hypothetical protein
MSRAIFEKPLAELAWSDFESVIFNGLEEDQTLEFKETLPVKDGNADSWQSGQNKISNYARDSLAKEVVAFANAYGGVIIIGIAETDEKPPRAKDFGDPLVRNCIDCIERLGPALRSLFDLPIAGFDIRAIPKPDCDNGEGLVNHPRWEFDTGSPWSRPAPGSLRASRKRQRTFHDAQPT